MPSASVGKFADETLVKLFSRRRPKTNETQMEEKSFDELLRLMEDSQKKVSELKTTSLLDDSDTCHEYLNIVLDISN